MNKFNLFKKYNVPGPRYTSYPTVPYWNQTPTAAEWTKSLSTHLEDGVKEGVGAALYIHIPFCYSLCTYCGCNTRITRNPAVGTPYVSTLLKEYELYLNQIEKTLCFSEIHLGGGTPTFLEPTELDRLVSEILSKSTLGKDPEFSVEADPRSTTSAHLKTLSRLGFKRLSLGIQDFDPKVQSIVHRVQSEECVQKVMDLARENGFKSINHDLIYGLPHQTPQSIKSTIEAVCRLQPDRIAFYSYAHVPWIKPGQRRFTEADLPTGEEKRVLYELGRNLLEAAGYFEIGMDHFALKSDSLWIASQTGTLHRSFMGYIARKTWPLIGIGVSSIGESGEIFSQNEKRLEVYQARVERGEFPIFRGHILNNEDLILKKHILNLMTQFETEWSDQKNYTPHLLLVPEKLKELIQDGLLKIDNNHCRLTALGRPFLRNICMAFDAQLDRKAPLTQLFSQTV